MFLGVEVSFAGNLGFLIMEASGVFFNFLFMAPEIQSHFTGPKLIEVLKCRHNLGMGFAGK